MKVRDRQRRVFDDFAKELDDIRNKRRKNGIDNKDISDARITRGIMMDRDWSFLKDRLLTIPRDPSIQINKKGKKK